MQPGQPVTGPKRCAQRSRPMTATARRTGAAAGGSASANEPARTPRGAVMEPGDCASWNSADWEATLERELGERNVAHWFRGSTAITVQRPENAAPVITIHVASAFLKTWMQRQFQKGLKIAASVVLGPAATIAFAVDESLSPQAHQGPSTNGDSKPLSSAGPARPRIAHTAQPNGPERLGTISLNAVANGPRSGQRNPAKFPPAESPAPREMPTPPAHSPRETRVGRLENSTNPKPTSGRPRMKSASSEPLLAPVFPEVKATAAAASTAHGTSNRDPIPAEAAGTGERTINAGLARLTRKLLDLSDFLEGDCNRLPLAAANQVCETPGLRINPLYLHGNVGVGKTHLLEGIYRKLRRQNPALQVVLLSAESFANHFTDALRQRTLPSFRQRFRTMDVLLVDDIDFLDGKQVIQEEFLHTVKQLEALGKQIVVTADRHPRLLNRVSEELVSRLLSGLVCRIENPDVETRRRIIAHKALKLECEISADVVNEIANRFSGNVRELEGAVHMLAVWQGMTKRRVTLSAARSVLADLERDCVRVVRMTDVEQTVCRFFGVSTDDLRSAKRTRTLSQPRMLAMYLARRLTQSAYKEIGAHFGGRNHSTVMSAERKVEEWLSEGATLRIASQNWQLPELLEAMEQQLRAC